MSDMKFLGYIRPDGSIGVRNKILIISTDTRTDRLCMNIAGAILDTVPVVSGPAKGQFFDDYLVTLIRNPNIAGAVVLELASDGVDEKLVSVMGEIGKPIEVINISDSGGLIKSTARAGRAAMLMARDASTFRRQPVFLSRLILGLIYEENSQMEDLLCYFIDNIIDNNGRVIIAKKVTNKKDKVINYPVVKKLETNVNIGKGNRDN